MRSLKARPNLDAHDKQHNNIFHMKCKVLSKTCLIVVDGGICANMVSDRLVLKLGLKESKHPKPYRLQWVGESDEVRVKNQTKVPLDIDGLKEEVLFDVIPMTVCHVLLGRPWEFDNRVVKDGYTNEYTLISKGLSICLRPLAPSVVYEAYIHLKKEREKDNKLESESLSKKPLGMEGESKSATLSECKGSFLATKSELGCALKSHKPLLLVVPQPLCLSNTNFDEVPSVVQDVLGEFEDVFLEALPNGLPSIRGIEHQVDFIPGASYQIGPHTKLTQMKPRSFKIKWRSCLPKVWFVNPSLLVRYRSF